MVIDKVDICRVLALELEHDPQITRHGHRPLSFALALQGMQPESGQIHITGLLADVQEGQNLLQLPRMLRGYPA